MELIYLAVPIGVFVGALFVAAFLWATWNGQFDDLDGPAHRAIHADTRISPRNETRSTPECPDANSHAPDKCARHAQAPLVADDPRQSARE